MRVLCAVWYWGRSNGLYHSSQKMRGTGETAKRFRTDLVTYLTSVDIGILWLFVFMGFLQNLHCVIPETVTQFLRGMDWNGILGMGRVTEGPRARSPETSGLWVSSEGPEVPLGADTWGAQLNLCGQSCRYLSEIIHASASRWDASCLPWLCWSPPHHISHSDRGICLGCQTLGNHQQLGSWQVPLLYLGEAELGR